jgi:hypothetical protein
MSPRIFSVRINYALQKPRQSAERTKKWTMPFSPILAASEVALPLLLSNSISIGED